MPTHQSQAIVPSNNDLHAHDQGIDNLELNGEDLAASTQGFKENKSVTFQISAAHRRAMARQLH